MWLQNMFVRDHQFSLLHSWSLQKMISSVKWKEAHCDLPVSEGVCCNLRWCSHQREAKVISYMFLVLDQLSNELFDFQTSAMSESMETEVLHDELLEEDLQVPVGDILFAYCAILWWLCMFIMGCQGTSNFTFTQFLSIKNIFLVIYQFCKVFLSNINDHLSMRGNIKFHILYRLQCANWLHKQEYCIVLSLCGHLG